MLKIKKNTKLNYSLLLFLPSGQFFGAEEDYELIIMEQIYLQNEADLLELLERAGQPLELLFFSLFSIMGQL